MSRRSLQVVQPRSCGTCSVCCGPGLFVTETGKTREDSCQHRSDAGCGIYETRPDACRRAKCAWLNRDADVFTGAARPDRIGVFAFGEDTADYGEVLVVYEARAGAARSPDVRMLVDLIVRRGTTVIVRDLQGHETLTRYQRG